MARSIDWDEVPDSNVVPKGYYDAKIESVQEAQSKAGNYMLVVQFKLTRPANVSGTMITERFALGWADDPNFENMAISARRFPVQRLKKMVAAAGVEMSSDFDELMADLDSQEVTLFVDVESGQTNPNTGEKYDDQNRIKAFFTPGEKDVGALDEEDTEPAPKKKTAAKKTKTTKAAVDDDDDDDEPAPKKKGKKKKADTMKCMECNELIPRDEFVDHADECEGAG